MKFARTSPSCNCFLWFVSVREDLLHPLNVSSETKGPISNVVNLNSTSNVAPCHLWRGTTYGTLAAAQSLLY